MTLRRREEHGNTFAPEIELSLGFDGIPLNGEEIIKRYGRKNIDPTVQFFIRGSNSIGGD
ncbi:MAG: hypothetical protein AB2L20_19185 [Mangrovibacterium sp.]